MPIKQADKAQTFTRLHKQHNTFVLANVFDAGSARMMAELGFKALATSSWVQAHMIGKEDGEATRDEALAHARIIVEATDLPVSADLVNGFGHAPEDVATTIIEAAAIGLVGASIEDATGDPANPIYDFDLAVRRIEAAAEAVRNLPFDFILTARSENYLHNINDLDDTIRRLQAFESAGADVLMAPGLPDIEAVNQLTRSLKKPVNYMVGMPGQSYSVVELYFAGVKRISLATSLYGTAMTAIREAASEVITQGSFGYTNR